MTAQPDEMTTDAETAGPEEIWEGEPLHLDRNEVGDTFWLGLVSTIALPGAHVHPAIRAAGEEVLGAQAELDQLRRKLAGRVAERDELMKSTRHLSDRAERLQKFESETAFLEKFDLPEAEAARTAAWESFAPP